MMIRSVLRLAFPLVLMPLAACAASGGEWPSLKTPAEKRADAGDAPVAMAEADAPAARPAPVATPATPDLAAIRARLAEERRDFEVAAKRWASQQATTEAAVTAARGAPAASEAWAKAQIELTRLSEAAAKFDDTRASVNRCAGDLAVLAAGGTDTNAILGDAGRLLRRIADAQAAHTEANQRLQGELAR